MFWGIFYILLLTLAVIYTLRYGDTEARYVAIITGAGSALTLALLFTVKDRFSHFETELVILDIIVFLAFFRVSLNSQRYWPLWIAAFQLVNLLTHLGKLLAPEIVPRVYSMAQGFWAYPIIAMMVWVSYQTKKRMQQASKQ